MRQETVRTGEAMPCDSVRNKHGVGFRAGALRMCGAQVQQGRKSWLVM